MALSFVLIILCFFFFWYFLLPFLYLLRQLECHTFKWLRQANIQSTVCVFGIFSLQTIHVYKYISSDCYGFCWWDLLPWAWVLHVQRTAAADNQTIWAFFQVFILNNRFFSHTYEDVYELYACCVEDVYIVWPRAKDTHYAAGPVIIMWPRNKAQDKGSQVAEQMHLN